MNSKACVVLNCRTCTRACKQYKSLQEEVEFAENESTSLATMLNFCCGISFEPQVGEAMPQHICLHCIQLLEQAFNFRRMVLDSDELLRLGLNETAQEHTNEEYIMIEMLNEDQEASGVTPDGAGALVERLSEPPEAEYVIETLAESELDSNTGTPHLGSMHEFSPADVEYVAIKSEYDTFVEEIDEIDVMDGTINDQMVEEVVLPGENTVDDVIAEVDESLDMDNDEQFLTCDSEDNNSDVDYLDESMDSIQTPGELLPHACTVCGKSFRQQCRLNQHMRSHVNEKLFKCEACGKKLKHLRNYKEHMLTHTNVKPHQCNICNRFYRTTSSLAAHKRTHAEDKPYKCDQCARSYAAFDHLRRHKLTHTGERPFACDLCDKAYYDSSSLRQHKISHTGEKAFTCEICGVGLSQKSGYKKHMLVHSGKKPHKCPICDRAFTFTSNLNAHVRLHSGEKPFKCDKCMKAFPTKKRLNSHLRVHNKEAPVTPTVGLSPGRRPAALQRSGSRSNHLPDVPDQQVSTSKVVVVL